MTKEIQGLFTLWEAPNPEKALRRYRAQRKAYKERIRERELLISRMTPRRGK